MEIDEMKKARFNHQKEIVDKIAKEAKEKYKGGRLYGFPIEDFGDNGIIACLQFATMNQEERKVCLKT